VAATLRIAHAAGLRVMATGGIGGVHRGAATSFDISADLETIARTPVLVVAAGAKSILDLPRTLAALDAHGVPVLGWQTDRFPAFHVADSGLTVPRLDDLDDVAATARRHWALGGGGVLVVQAPPSPLPADEVEAWTRTALSRAEAAGVAGPAVTPFLLAELATVSGGRTLAANRDLAVANAELAAQIAVRLHVEG
jgi:pseudouridine-5'-phosphate glycosidase